MKENHGVALFSIAAMALLVSLCVSISAAAQAGTATPRTADGHPNLSGYWGPPPQSDILIAEAAAATPPAYKPEYQSKVDALKKDIAASDPTRHCQPAGVPRMGAPWEIVQIPGAIYFIYGDRREGLRTRVIPIDGRPHDEEIDSRPMGDSIGRWEGDTLVVDVIKIDDDTWIDRTAPLHDENLHVVERFTRKGNTLEYEVTAEDPTVLAKPWKKPPQTLVLTPGQHPLEGSPCSQ